MPGAGTSSQQANTASKTQPWKPAQPALKGILGGVEQGLTNYQPNPNETAAFDTLRANAGITPDIATPLTNLAGEFGTGGIDRTGYLTQGYSDLQKQLGQYANNLDPSQFPGMQELLATITGDVSNNVNSYFAGAGRDLSGMNAQTLARGLAQGLSAPLLGQYNQNIANQMNAANALFGAAGQTAGGLSNLDQTALGNKAQGINLLGQVPMAQDLAANRALGVEGAARGLPIQNLGQLASLAVPIAGLGSQTTGTTSQISNLSPIQQFYLASAGLGSLFGGK